MPTPEEIRQQIRDVLDQQSRAIALSKALFSPGGLFNQLATTEQERREVATSDLFREAQRRLTQLQKQEAAEFSRAVQDTQSRVLTETGSVRVGI